MQEYSSLDTIMARKAELSKEIKACEKDISTLWNATFHAKKIDSSSKTQRFLSFATTASGIIDGALFGWKLYKKLHK